MQQFRSKPVVIEAVQWDGKFATAESIEAWSERKAVCDARGRGALAVFIATLEGEMRADVEDWIIKGTKGEFYPCKPDVFAHKYEPVADATMTAPTEAESATAA